jgi:ABC-2 type transport system ATP-binding protein
MQYLSIQGLEYAYRGQSSLFNGLSLQLQPGGITGVLGRNGAGKTTLLKLTAGLLYPNHGSVTVGTHSPSLRQPAFLQDIYFVPEEFYLPSVSMAEFVRLNAIFYPRFDTAVMDHLTETFELSTSERTDRLSFGQKKKFLISFALATRCRLLILDEPTNGLDIPSKAIFRQVMAGTLDDDQLVLISTHQVKDVDNLIDRVVILSNGQVIFNKELHDISATLQFVHSSVADGDDVLYSEANAGGYNTIRRTGNGQSAVDIELLFNAITSGTKLFSA